MLVEVTGELKIGNFTLSFTDLTVPVSGIPITVARTYDSLNAASQNDFGYGWRLEFADTDVRTSVAKTGAEEDLIYNPFHDGARVYVTLPGGQREGFTFRLTPAPGYAGSILGIFEGSFVPDADVTSTLMPAREFSLRATDFGEALDYNTGLSWNPFSPTFGGTLELTTREGIRYTIDGGTGDLQQVADRNGNALTFSDAGIFSSTGQSVTFERDPRGRIAAVVDPAGNRVEYAYDVNGDLVSVTDREDNVTRLFYVEPARPHFLTEIVDPLGRTGIRSQYDDQGRLTRMVDAAGQQIELVHDPNNFVDIIHDPLGNPTTYEYDGLGNVLTEIDAEGGVTRYAYDDAGRPVQTISANGSSTQSVFDQAGRLTQRIDQAGRATDYEYDSLGRLTVVMLSEVDDPLNATRTRPRTEYEYDERGSLVVQRDANGKETRFEYDGQGRRTATVLPLGQRLATGYDAVGNVTATTDFNGDTITYEYDERGRLVVKRFSDGTAVEFGYTLNGLRETITDARGLTQFQYDTRDQLLSRTDPDGVAISYTYDAAGNRTSLTIPSGITQFTFDTLNRLETVVDPDLDVTRHEYDAESRLTRTELPNGAVEMREYDELNRLLSVEHRDALDAVFASFDYDLDATRNRTAVTEHDGRRVEYEYDELYRLTGEDIFDPGAVTASRALRLRIRCGRQSAESRRHRRRADNVWLRRQRPLDCRRPLAARTPIMPTTTTGTRFRRSR